MAPKKEVDLSAWQANEDTGKRLVAGVEVDYLKNPPARKVSGILRQYSKDPDKMNMELVKFLVQSPEVTTELWDDMNSSVMAGLVSLALETCGLEQSFQG